MKKKLRVLISIVMVLSIIFTIPLLAKSQVNLKNGNVKYLESSFDIEVKNLDLRSVSETHPIEEEQKIFLLELGYKEKTVDSMDIDDYNKIYAKLNIDESTKKFLIDNYSDQCSSQAKL